MPHLTHSIKKIQTNAEFVLVVEKDTVFKKLLLDGVLARFDNKCILVTVS